MNKPDFTKEQKDFICHHIDEWYLYWKEKLVDYDNKTHRLGYAKEGLKILLLESIEDIEKMIYEIKK